MICLISLGKDRMCGEWILYKKTHIDTCQSQDHFTFRNLSLERFVILSAAASCNPAYCVFGSSRYILRSTKSYHTGSSSSVIAGILTIPYWDVNVEFGYWVFWKRATKMVISVDCMWGERICCGLVPVCRFMHELHMVVRQVSQNPVDTSSAHIEQAHV